MLVPNFWQTPFGRSIFFCRLCPSLASPAGRPTHSGCVFWLLLLLLLLLRDCRVGGGRGAQKKKGGGSGVARLPPPPGCLRWHRRVCVWWPKLKPVSYGPRLQRKGLCCAPNCAVVVLTGAAANDARARLARACLSLSAGQCLPVHPGPGCLADSKKANNPPPSPLPEPPILIRACNAGDATRRLYSKI